MFFVVVEQLDMVHVEHYLNLFLEHYVVKSHLMAETEVYPDLVKQNSGEEKFENVVKTEVVLERAEHVWV